VLRQAFVDRTLEASLDAASKAAAGAAFAMVTPDKPPNPEKPLPIDAKHQPQQLQQLHAHHPPSNPATPHCH
jgi:hypothetical protein